MSETVTGLRVNEDGSVTEVTLTVTPASGPPRQRPRSQWVPALVILNRIAPEYAAIRKAAADQLEAGNGQLMLWIDTLTAQSGCSLTDPVTLAAKAALVQANLLTQQRADAVFAPV
jgi:hypothetical protein